MMQHLNESEEVSMCEASGLPSLSRPYLLFEGISIANNLLSHSPMLFADAATFTVCVRREVAATRSCGPREARVVEIDMLFP